MNHEHDLIDTTEMYLRTILELEEEGQVPMRARIAERLDQSGPTVSQTVARMERDGLLVVSGDRHLELTNQGRKDVEPIGRRVKNLPKSSDLIPLARKIAVEVVGEAGRSQNDNGCQVFLVEQQS